MNECKQETVRRGNFASRLLSKAMSERTKSSAQHKEIAPSDAAEFHVRQDERETAAVMKSSLSVPFGQRVYRSANPADTSMSNVPSGFSHLHEQMLGSSNHRFDLIGNRWSGGVLDNVVGSQRPVFSAKR